MKVVLRNEHDAQGTRYLSVAINDKGDLVVEGQDLGSAVEQIFGAREYEWTRSIAAAELPKVFAAFGVADAKSLLDALHARFASDASGLDAALEATGAKVEKWSRVGD